MIVGSVVEVWDLGGSRALSDPLCEMTVDSVWSDDGAYVPGNPCGEPATVRVNNWPHWSMFWCPEHAETFSEPRDFFPGYFDHDPRAEPDIEEPTFIRRRAVS